VFDFENDVARAGRPLGEQGSEVRPTIAWITEASSISAIGFVTMSRHRAGP